MSFAEYAVSNLFSRQCSYDNILSNHFYPLPHDQISPSSKYLQVFSALVGESHQHDIWARSKSVLSQDVISNVEAPRGQNNRCHWRLIGNWTKYSSRICKNIAQEPKD